MRHGVILMNTTSKKKPIRGFLINHATSSSKKKGGRKLRVLIAIELGWKQDPIGYKMEQKTGL